jgi:hypothetical protein
VRIEIADVEQSTSDTKGKFAVFGVRTPKNERHMLVMPLTTASKLVTMIFNSGLIAHQALGEDESRVVSTHFPVRPTTVNAGMHPNGGVDLVLRFGQLSIAAALDPTDARSLAESLLQLVAQGPATRQ